MALDIKASIRRRLARFTAGLWIWLGVAFAIVLTAALLAGKIFLAGSDLKNQAIDNGQQVSVRIASGEVDGNPRHTLRTAAVIEPSSEPGVAAPVLSKEGLAPAPLEALTVSSDKGVIPVIGKDGTLPWKYYARPYDAKAKRPIIAILITNLGLSRPLTEEVFQLPHSFTLAFSPYASDAKEWAKRAREIGFESLVDLPMEADDYPMSDPGPYGLLDNLTPLESNARLHWMLSRFPGFVGALAPANEKLTANLNAIRSPLVELSGHGVLFIYLKTDKNAGLADLAKSRQLYALGADSVIDATIAPDAIDAQLQNLTAIAKTRGFAIGIAHSYPPTIDALTHWSEELGAQGVDLAPVSAIALRVYP